ncbi:MAG: DHHA1 domain-containing protein [Fusobacteriaceae bacterium]
MRVFNITHTDFDGLGCQLAIENRFGKENVTVERCGYNNVNGCLYTLLKSGEYLSYDRIYITDISISLNMAKWVDSEEAIRSRVILIDHHGTAEWLNEYNWATIKTHNEDGTLVSASMLVANHLELDGLVIRDIIRQADDYDTWKWASNGNVKAKTLNDLIHMVGMDNMLAEFHNQIASENREFEIADKYQFLLEVRDNEYKNYLETTNKNLVLGGYKQHSIGICFAEKFTSELGNDLAKLNPNLDFIAILNMRTGLSLRSVKEGIDLGLVAKEIGDMLGMKGGGHKMAAGITLTTDFKLGLVKGVFEILER